MIYDSVSVKQVIAKVLTDNDIHEENHRIADMIEWAGEALERIGAFPQLEIKVAGKGGEPMLKIENYQATLPLGLHGIIQAVYTTSESSTTPYYPMRYGSGSFDAVPKITYLDDKGTEDPSDDEYTTRDENVYETNKSLDFIYVVAGRYIKTNIKDGYIMLAYTTIPLDDEGYPKVPNNISFLEALYWYITMKLLYPKWVNGEIRDGIYMEAKRSWSFYRKQAYGEALMPQGDQLESIKNTWNQLIPELNADGTFFSTVGQKEILYNQTNGKIDIYPIIY